MSVAPEQAVNPYALYSAFRETEYGHRLSGFVRYERYKPDATTNTDWEQLLGPDVNNLKHNVLTLGLTDDFIRTMDRFHPGELAEHDKVLLRVGAASHDWGEAIVGDITDSHKTKEGQQREKEAFLHIVTSTMSGVSGADMVIEAANEVVFDQKNARLGRMFNIVERVGYMRTALRAHACLEFVDDAELRDGLRWLTLDVLGNHTRALVEYSAWLRPPGLYLEAAAEQIDSAFAAIEGDVYDRYAPEEVDAKQEQVEVGRASWHAWAAGNVAIANMKP